jgi:hypothetical protein
MPGRNVVRCLFAVDPAGQWTEGRASCRLAGLYGNKGGNDVIPLVKSCETLSGAGSPNQRAQLERVIRTLKSECLNAFVIVAERHLNHVCGQFQSWYNRERGHSARDHLPPAWDKPPDPALAVDSRNIVCTTWLGGFLKSYSRRVAYGGDED